MAFISTTLTTDPAAPRPRVIGYDRDGEMIWASAGGRGSGNLGIQFAVDDRDGDEPDDFDDTDDEDDDGDEYEIEDADDEDDDTGEDDDEADQRPRGRRKRNARDARDDGDEHDDTGWQPPSQGEWTKVQESLRRNNAELQRNREARKIMQKLGLRDASEFADFLISRGFDPDNGDPLGGQDATDDGQGQNRQETIIAHRRAEQRGAEREAGKWRPALVQFAAADALRDAGFSGSSMASVLRLLDADSVEVTFEDGEPVVYGLDEQVASIKNELPELFRPKRPATRQRGEDGGGDGDAEDGRTRPVRRRENGRTVTGARQVDGGERPRPAGKKLGWLEMTDRQMRGLPARPTRRGR